MSLISRGSKPIAVLKRPEDPDHPWWVCCALCKPSMFSLFVTDSASGPVGLIQVVGRAPDALTARKWAVRHAIDHELRRCPTCLHMPQGVVDTPNGAHA